MPLRHALTSAALALCAASAAWPLLAWSAPPTPAVPVTPPSAAPAQGPTGARSPEPAVQRTVLEDDNVRIEELTVRGQAQRITVQNKTGGNVTSRYEIITGDGGHDPSQDRRATGQRVWQLFSF